MEKTFLRVRSARDLALSVVLILAGAACVIFKTPISVNILGFFIIILGIVIFFMLKTERKDSETGIRYHKTTKYFSSDKKPEVLAALDGDVAGFDWAEQDSSEGLRVDIYFNPANDKVFAHCYQYIPYEYIPCSDWYELTLSKTGNLAK